MSGVKVGAAGTKYVRLEIDVWYQESDQSIHVTAPGLPSFHTTINDKEGSKRCHSNLYKKLRELLQENGRWPAGQEAES